MRDAERATGVHQRLAHVFVAVLGALLNPIFFSTDVPPIF
jgi:hypothetical protein